MKLDYLREFIVVAETLNFTAAAEKLFITQSALSRHIKLLEDYLGARLLDRDTHGVRLTSIGKIAYAESKRVVSILDTVRVKAALMQQGSSGAIRLGGNYFLMRYLDLILPTIKAKFPEISLEIVSYQPSQAYHALIEGSIDIALLFHHSYPEDERLVFVDFTTEPLILVSQQGHPLSKKPHVSVKELDGQVLVRFKNNFLSDYVNALLRKHHVIAKEVVFSDSVDTLHYSLLESNGVAIEPLVFQSMPRRELVYTPFAEKEIEVPISVVYRADTNNQAVFSFIEAVGELAQK